MRYSWNVLLLALVAVLAVEGCDGECLVVRRCVTSCDAQFGQNRPCGECPQGTFDQQECTRDSGIKDGGDAATDAPEGG